MISEGFKAEIERFIERNVSRWLRSKKIRRT
jgi:hypothetical protein